MPLHIRDRFDASSILWVGVTFNQTLPRAENWPSSENWPDFSKLQKISKAQAISSWNLIKLIQENTSYEMLMKKLEGKIFSNPVVFEIGLDGASSRRFLARYRFAEVLLPGQPAKRIALRPDTLPAACSFSTPELQFKFYEFAGNKKPACQLRISTPCAPLKLVMTPGKNPVGQTSFKVPYTINGEKLVFKVNIE